MTRTIQLPKSVLAIFFSGVFFAGAMYMIWSAALLLFALDFFNRAANLTDQVRNLFLAAILLGISVSSIQAGRSLLRLGLFHGRARSGADNNVDF